MVFNGTSDNHRNSVSSNNYGVFDSYNHGIDNSQQSEMSGSFNKGTPGNLQALMDSRRSKSNTSIVVTQDIVDRQKKISSTKHDFINEKIIEKKTQQNVIQNLKT